MQGSFEFDDFLAVRDSVQSLLSKTRRDLHQLAESAFGEWNTFDYLVRRLAALPGRFEYLTDEQAGRHAELLDKDVRLHGSEQVPQAPLPCFKYTLTLREGPGVEACLRCDLDALPLTESGDPSRLPVREGFVSHNGCAHACAHDGHMAVALTLIDTLARHGALLTDTSISKVSFIFEPAEEGCRGAAFVTASDFLQDVDELYCFHLGMGLKSGLVSPSPEGFLNTEKFSLCFRGKSAHAGHPELGVNALKPLAAFMNEALKFPDPAHGTFLNIAAVNVPGPVNAIPALACLKGEIRAAKREDLSLMHSKIMELLAGAGTQNCDELSEDEFMKAEVGDRPLSRFALRGRACDIRQDRELTGLILRAAHSLNLKTVPFSFSASEDASLLIEALQQRGGKGCYFVVGADITAPHHSPDFDFDEKSMADAYYVILKALCSHF